MKTVVWRRPNTAEDGPLLVAMRTEKGYEYVTEAVFMNGVPVDGECMAISGECVAVADMPEFPEESEIAECTCGMRDDFGTHYSTCASQHRR